MDKLIGICNDLDLEQGRQMNDDVMVIDVRPIQYWQHNDAENMKYETQASFLPDFESEYYLDKLMQVDLQTEQSQDATTKIVRVWQHADLFPHLNVVDNLTLMQMKVLHLDRLEAHSKALNYLSQVGLYRQALKFPADLSAGEQFLVAVARSLCVRPQVILLNKAMQQHAEADRDVDLQTVMKALLMDGLVLASELDVKKLACRQDNNVENNVEAEPMEMLKEESGFFPLWNFSYV